MCITCQIHNANHTQSAKGEDLVPTVNHGNNPRYVPVFVGTKHPWKEITLVVLNLLLFISTFPVPYQSFLPSWRQYDNLYAINLGGNNGFNISPNLGSAVQFMLEVSREGSLHLSAKNCKDRQMH